MVRNATRISQQDTSDDLDALLIPVGKQISDATSRMSRICAV